LGVAYEFNATPANNLHAFLKEFEIAIEFIAYRCTDDTDLLNEFKNLYNDMSQFYNLCTGTLNLQDPSYLLERDFLVNRYFFLMQTGNPKEINNIIISLLFYLNVKFFVSPYRDIFNTTIMDISLHNDEYSIKAFVGPKNDKRFFGTVNTSGKVIDDSSNPVVTRKVFGQFFPSILEHFGLERHPSLEPFKQPITTLTPQEQCEIKNPSTQYQFNYELSKTECAVFLTFSTLKEAETFYLKNVNYIYPIRSKSNKNGSYLAVIDSEHIEGKFSVRIPRHLTDYTFEAFCKNTNLKLPAVNEIPFQLFQVLPDSLYFTERFGAHLTLTGCDELKTFLEEQHPYKQTVLYEDSWGIFKFEKYKYSINQGRDTKGAVVKLLPKGMKIFNNTTTVKQTAESATKNTDRKDSLDIALKKLNEAYFFFKNKTDEASKYASKEVSNQESKMELPDENTLSM
jgi:hypothetical protein